MKFRPFAEAKDYVHSLEFKSEMEWRKYKKSGKKPQDIPYDPVSVYEKEWKGMGDWLGTGRIADQKRKFRPFAEAREYIHSLKLPNEAEWRKYCKSGRKPADIPYKPSRTYEKEWKGMGDWLGTGNIAPGLREFKPFAEAREFVHSLGLQSEMEWRKYCKPSINQVFGEDLRPQSSVGETANVDKLERNLRQLEHAIVNKASPEALMEIVHIQIHPTLQQVYDLKLLGNPLMEES